MRPGGKIGRRYPLVPLLDIGRFSPYHARSMRTSDFDYALPPELIAQHPAKERDQSRLLVLDRKSGTWAHRRFPDLKGYLQPGDVLIMNNSRVIPARLRGQNVRTGGKFELLLLEENSTNDWWTMVRPGKRAPKGTEIRILDAKGAASPISCCVTETNAEGHRRVRFTGVANILSELDALGEIPLPPYIQRADQSESGFDKERYQTVYAKPLGSVAAPTAGLHFTPGFLKELEAKGVQVGYVTLHVGLGTFAPVKAETLAEHTMHEERFEVSATTAEIINAAKSEGRRVIAVGTTSLRVLETLGAPVQPGSGRTRIFIFPPHEFRVVDALVTNFHLPCSTLLMLVSALARPGGREGRDLMLRAYAEAIREQYRFFSYGDAMFIQ